MNQPILHTIALQSGLGKAVALAQDTPMQTTGSPVVVLTEIATSWCAPRFMVIRKFRETVAEYDNLPSLDDTYYTISADNKFGGLYLWKDRASAKAWFNEAWMTSVLKTRGAPAEVRMYKAPVLLDNVAAGSAAPSDDSKAVNMIVSVNTSAGITHDQLSKASGSPCRCTAPCQARCESTSRSAMRVGSAVSICWPTAKRPIVTTTRPGTQACTPPTAALPRWSYSKHP